MKLCAKSDCGKIRAVNQDALAHCELAGGRFLLVCDGMGGANAGHVASETAVREIVAHMQEYATAEQDLKDIRSVMRNAYRAANQAIFKMASENEEQKGMGTTAVSAFVRGREALFMNIGDSRAYLLSSGSITQVTEDHSLVQEMVQKGQLTRDEAMHHPNRNLITMALGTEAQILPDCYERSLLSGDILLLCSDGLNSVVADEDILRTVQQAPDLCAACADLVEAANNKGGPDNTTVLLHLV